MEENLLGDFLCTGFVVGFANAGAPGDLEIEILRLPETQHGAID